MKKYILPLLFVSTLLFSCTKEVNIDIPGYVKTIVVDGSITTGQPPIVLLSSSQDIFSPTNLQAYIDGFISGAVVTVSNGTNTVTLTEFCTDNLPAGTEAYASSIFGIPVDQLASVHLCAYTSLDPSIWGEVGKAYTLSVTHEGKTYNSVTTIGQPTPLTSLLWIPEPGKDYAKMKGVLSDPPGQYDAYKWEIKYLKDPVYTKDFNPFFNDQFFDGLTFDFDVSNRMGYVDSTISNNNSFHLGDTVVIKMSKLGKPEYSFFEKKYNQIYSGGNPFATPTNIPSNIDGGAYGVWVGYSPWYDTIICQ